MNFICLPAFHLIMCLMKSPKNFEKIAILKKWQLISFWGVKIHFNEKYAWFAIEILIHVSKSCLLYMLWSQNIVKKSSTTFSENNNYWRGNIGENKKIHTWKCIFSGVFYRSQFWHLRRKTAIIFSKWLFFQNSLGLS